MLSCVHGVCALAALLVLLVPALVSAQADVSTGTLAGSVTDETRAVLVGATITVTFVERGTQRTAMTEGTGVFRVPLLDSGVYEVRIDAQGFSSRVFQGVAMRVGEVVTLDVQLALAGVTGEVIVTAGEQLIDVRRTQQASTVTARQVTYLPNVRRDFTPYVLILPGVSDPEAPRAQNPGMAWPSTGFAMGGSNGHGNLLTIDGGEHEYGTGVFRTPINLATVQEFQVNRSAFAAEFGFTSGSAVNLVTKSGTNRLVGETYAFYRGDELAARSYFDPPGSRAPFQTLTGGGTLGGPLVLNRIFGFAAYEGWKSERVVSKPYLENLEVYGPTSNPLASITLRAQDAYLRQLATSSDAEVRRIGATLRQQLTANSFPATMRQLADNAGQRTAKDRRHYWTGRVDVQMAPAETVTARFTRFRSTTDQSFVSDSPLSAPNNAYVISAPDYSLLGSWSRVLGSGSVNQVRVQVASNDSVLDPVTAEGTSINIDGVATFGRHFNTPFGLRQNRYQFEDVFSHSRGTHTVKLGASYRPIDYAVRHELWFGGDWQFASGIYPLLLAVAPNDQPRLIEFNVTTIDPATGAPYPATGPALAALSGLQSFNFGLPFLYRQGFGNPEWNGWAHYLGTFAQDTWQISRQLTLDYGMRVDIDAEPAPLGRHTYVSPRLGAAWDLTGEQRTVIRGGAGLFYGPVGVQVPYFGALLDDSGLYINQVFKTPLDGRQSPAALWAAGTSIGKLPSRALTESDLGALGVQIGRGAPGRVIFEVDPEYENPHTIQTSVGVSRQLMTGLALEAAYLMYRGRDLGLSHEANYRETGTPDPLLGPRYIPIDPTIVQRNVARSIGSSTYHGATVSIVRPFRNAFQFEAHYTLAKAEDDVTDTDSALAAFMPTRLDREWARSVFDVRHTFTAHAVILMPAAVGGGGILRRMLSDVAVAPVIRARSGGPFTLRIGRDINGDTHSAYDRPFHADRNTGNGPGFFAIDLRVSRAFPLRRMRLEVVGEATNVTNRTNFTSVNDVIGTDPEFLRAPFDREGRAGVSRFTPLAFNAAAPGRQIQVGLQLRF